MTLRGFLCASVIALAALLPASARAQIQPGGSVLIDKTPIVGGTNGRCLYDNAGKIGETASCGLAGAITVGSSVITGGTNTRVLYDNAGVLGEYTATQVTALINVATASLSGALPAWPNNTTTFFRGDGSYATLNCAALTNATSTCTTSIGTSGATIPLLSTANTWTLAQTFTAAPVFTDAAGTRTALGLGALATVTPGTGIATALAVNVGTAGAPVINGGALGTPLSGVATNLTNIPVANATGVLPAANGGAGTINGALKGNGSGTVSQAASTDLSDTTTATTWVPTDQSGASLTFSSTAGSYYSKSNKTCVGMVRVVYPSNANGSNATVSLPCTLPSAGVNMQIGSCGNTPASNIVTALVGINNTATAVQINTAGGIPTNATFSLGTLSCNFSFVSQ